MKKTKKLAALVLAMMMALSVMAVTAAAYSAEEHEHECAVCCEDEGVMPLYVVGRCPRCGGVATYTVDATTGKTHVVCLSPDVCGYSGWLY